MSSAVGACEEYLQCSGSCRCQQKSSFRHLCRNRFMWVSCRSMKISGENSIFCIRQDHPRANFVHVCVWMTGMRSWIWGLCIRLWIAEQHGNESIRCLLVGSPGQKGSRSWCPCSRGRALLPSTCRLERSQLSRVVSARVRYVSGKYRMGDIEKGRG